MKLRKFRAPTMRDALAHVRRELGPEALIIATKPIRSGGGRSQLEVTAAIDDEHDAEESPARRELANAEEAAEAANRSSAELEQIMLPLRSELRALRGLVRSSTSRRRTDRGLKDEVAALQKAVTALSMRNGAPGPSLQEMAQGKVLAKGSNARMVAVVGPTGVGKTTAIAKLAARAALIERKSVHILSLDNHRVGAPAQIRSFGQLMGVPVSVVTHLHTQLAAALHKAKSADLVLVDTAGRSLRDLSGPRKLERQLEGLPEPEVHLAIAAGTSCFDVDTIVARYAPLGVRRLLFTKVDETGDLGELVRAPARHSIPVCYLATGQQVPEDIEDATQDGLISLANDGFKLMEVA